jgi:hypothetical protein
MSGRCTLLAVLLLTGCHGLPPKHKLGKAEADYPPGLGGAAGSENAPCEGGQCLAGGHPVGHSGPCPPPCAKPQVEVCQQPQQPEIQVNVPRQKIVIPRRPGMAGAPAAAASIPGRTVTEQQQIVQTRQVVLMPQQVLVPFVQTTVSGPIRVSEAQETSILNLASTTTTAGAAVATGQVAVVPGAAAVAGQGTASAAGAASAAASPQNMTECLAQLRAYEQRINQLMAQTEVLAAQVEALKGGIPAPRPK